MRQSFDIFIGGPMGGQALDPAGLPFAQHLGNMRLALDRVADEINQEQSAYTVRIQTPELDDAGMITSRVFGLLDTAELGVMDVSAGSPSVMYELAMLHALGIPTIPVVFRDADGRRNVPFYLKDSYQAVVDSFDVDALYERLAPMVRMVVRGGDAGADPTMNPMTAYYTLPMVDISASTGLATGYFHNFLRHILKPNGGVFDFLDGQVDQLVVVRPAKLTEAEGLKQAAERRLVAEGIKVEWIGERDGKVYEEPESTRKQMLIYRAGRYLFDAPAPLAAQETSPRMRRIRKQLIPASGGGPVAQEARAMVEKFEQRMIDEFMAVLLRLADEYPGTRADRLATATLDEFVGMARG